MNILSSLPLPSKTGLPEAFAAACAVKAAGADGLLIEVHPKPEEALCDGAPSLRPETFTAMMDALGVIAQAVGRRV